jgi:uncharacterized membrane protein
LRSFAQKLTEGFVCLKSSLRWAVLGLIRGKKVEPRVKQKFSEVKPKNVEENWLKCSSEINKL